MFLTAKTQQNLELIVIEDLITHLESKDGYGFGKEKCKDYDEKCPNCNGHKLIELLKWYRELL